MKKPTSLKEFFKKTSASMSKKNRRKPVFIIIPILALAVCLLFVYGLTNFYLHKDKTYSNLYLANHKTSNVSGDELVEQINATLSQTNVELSYSGQKEVISAKNLGIYASEESLRGFAENKGFLDAFQPWFAKNNQNLDLNIDDKKLEAALKKFKTESFKPAKDATFTIKNGELVINEENNGFGLDSNLIGVDIISSLSSNLAPLFKQFEVADIEARINGDDIRSLSQDIKDKINKKYSIAADGLVVTADRKQVGIWLKVIKQKDGTAGIEVSSENVKQYVKELAGRFSVSPINQITSVYKSGKKSEVTTKGKKGRGPTNIDSIAKDIVDKLNSGESYSGQFIFNEIDFRKIKTEVDNTVLTASYTYNVVVWGSIKSDIASFKALAAQTLSDSRGWSSGGVSFQEVASGGDFTLVLAEPSRVASASSTCSSNYSCRVGRNVIINDDRWRLATPSWNGAGGSLRDYRHMVVNHETGHWLGFAHRFCSGAGQLAPVMQQQSISLQGCKFNPWPTASEISSL